MRIVRLLALGACASLGCTGPSAEQAPAQPPPRENVAASAPLVAATGGRAAVSEGTTVGTPDRPSEDEDLEPPPTVEVYPSFAFPFKCAADVVVGEEIGKEYPTAARAGTSVDPSRFGTIDATVLGNSIFRLVTPFGLERSMDQGATWTALDVPRLPVSRRVASDPKGNLWVVGYREALVSSDLAVWKHVELPPPHGSRPNFYDELLTVAGAPWIHSRDAHMVVRLSAVAPPESWLRVATPGLETKTKLKLAAIGSKFVGLGNDANRTVSVVFDQAGFSEEVIGPRGNPTSIACAGASCVGQGEGDIVARQGLEGAWKRHGDTLDLAKWFVKNCPTKALGDVAGVIRRGKFHKDNAIAFTISQWGFVFDGRTLAVALGAAENNGWAYPFTLFLGPAGIRVVAAGGDGVSLLRSGEFWLYDLGEGIIPVTVRYNQASP